MMRVITQRPVVRVIIESPYYSPDREEQERNIEYGLDCLRDSLTRGETPFASHLLYTRVLDDAKVDDRRLGLTAALGWIESADRSAIYIDRGVSSGMRLGIQHAVPSIAIEVRSLRGTRVERLQAAYNRRSSSLALEQCLHQLDSPVFDSDEPTIIGWRCGCGQTRGDREVLP